MYYRLNNWLKETANFMTSNMNIYDVDHMNYIDGFINILKEYDLLFKPSTPSNELMKFIEQFVSYLLLIYLIL